MNLKYEKQVNGSIIALTMEDECYLLNSEFDKIYTKSFQNLKHEDSKFYSGKRNDKWALLDGLGNMYSDFIFEEIRWFISDLFLCNNANGWVLINSDSNDVLGETFNKLISLKNEVAIFQNHNEYVFVNGSHDILNRVKYINENAEFSDAGLAIIRLEDGRKGIINKNGEWFVKPSILHTN